MHPDDLDRPLGLDADPASRPRREIPWAAIAFGGLLVLGAGIVTFGRLTETAAPERVAAAAPPAKQPAGAQSPGVSHEDVTATIAPQPPRSTAGQIEESSGVRVVRQGGGGAPGALIITVPQEATASLAPAPDPRLVEVGRFGPLPRIAADGAKPMDVYARPVIASAKLPPSAPRVAILVGGMGLNAQTTSTAISSLPAGVTLGFAPYGRNLSELAARAREKGHETILQTPMEGFGGEAEEPGPHVLRTGATANELLSRLHWHMSRYQGYAGVAGFMGARFTSDATAFGIVMREVTRRGLFYFDDGASARSQALALAAEIRAPIVRADVTIEGEPAALDEALARLEKLARERGYAVGYANGLPVAVDRIARFARRLESRGVMLAPVSAMTRPPEQTTARAAP